MKRIFKFLFLIFFLILISNSFMGNSFSSDWIEKQIKNTPKGSGRAIVSFENKILLVNGLNCLDYEEYKAISTESDNSLYELDGDKWKSFNISGLESGKINLGGAIIKDKIWFFGSFMVKDKWRSKEVSFIDLKKKKFEQLKTEGDSPYLRYGYCMAGRKVGEDLYFLSMYGGKVYDEANGKKIDYLSDELYILSNKCLEWNKVSFKGDNPGKRQGATFVSVGSKMYLTGGIDENGNYLDDIWLVNPFGREGIFSKQEYEGNLINAAFRASTVVEDRYILLLGGESKIGGKTRPIKNVDVYDTYEKILYSIEDLPIGIRMGSAAISDTTGTRSVINLYGGKKYISNSLVKNENLYTYSFDRKNFYKYLK